MSSGPVLLTFCIWMLLSGEFSLSNAMVGMVAAFLVSLLPRHRFSAGQLIYLAISILVWLPKTVWETFLIVILPHRYERISTRRVMHANNPWAVFSQTLVITITPKTLVVGEEKKGWLRVHSIERKERS